MEEPPDIELPVQEELIEQENRQNNPFMNPLILDNIFRFVIGSPSANETGRMKWRLIDKDVQSIRLVCRLWRDRVTRIYRDQRPPTRFGLPNFNTLDTNLQEFVDTMKNSELIPVQRYIIGGCYLIEENRQLISDFTEVCVPEAVKLCFNIGDRSKVILPSLNYSGINLSKLKVLKFSCREYPANPENCSFFNCMSAILMSALNLEELSCSIKDHCGNTSENLALAKVLAHIPETVRDLDLRMPNLSHSHLRIISDRKLKLNKCKLSARYRLTKSKNSALQDFLAGQSGTLQTLILGENVPITFPEFPCMEELLEIHFIRRWNPARREEYGDPTCIPEIFPKLAILNMQHLTTDCENILSCPSVVRTVQELYLPIHIPPSPFPLVRCAAERFPNVTKLHITDLQLSKAAEILRDVFVQFGNLVELTVGLFPFTDDCQDFCLDSLLSGVSNLDFAQILLEDRFDIIDLTRVQCQPSLLNLTALRKLVLISRFGDGPTITKFSGHFVLSKMASMEKLKICGLKVTPECACILRNSLKIVDIEQADDECTDVDETSNH